MSDVLIWSNQQSRWWRANGRGYTSLIEEAGRYPLVEALGIVAGSTCNGELVHERVDPVTGRAYQSLDEVVVPTPEALVVLGAAERLAEQLCTAADHVAVIHRLNAALDTAAEVTSKLAHLVDEAETRLQRPSGLIEWLTLDSEGGPTGDIVARGDVDEVDRG